MPISLTDFNNGDTVSASDVEQRIRSMENFLNGGTSQGDFGTSWIHTDLIVRPEFYGSPAPRAQMVSADSHYRHTMGSIENAVIFYEDLSDEYLPVPGLGVSFHLPEAANIYVMCCFRTFEVGAYGKDRSPTTELEEKLAAYFRLFVNDSGIGSTERTVYANTDGTGSSSANAGTNDLARKNHSMLYHHTSTLSAGTHNVCVKMKINGDTNSTRKFGRIFVTRRNIIVHAQYL